MWIFCWNNNSSNEVLIKKEKRNLLLLYYNRKKYIFRAPPKKVYDFDFREQTIVYSFSGNLCFTSIYFVVEKRFKRIKIVAQKIFKWSIVVYFILLKRKINITNTSKIMLSYFLKSRSWTFFNSVVLHIYISYRPDNSSKDN